MNIEKEFAELKSAFLKFESALESLNSENKASHSTDTESLIEKVKSISLLAMEQGKLTRIDLKRMVNKYGPSITKIESEGLEALIKDIEGALQ